MIDTVRRGRMIGVFRHEPPGVGEGCTFFFLRMAMFIRFYLLYV
jgi:hypothetical protein